MISMRDVILYLVEAAMILSAGTFALVLAWDIAAAIARRRGER